MTQYQTKDSQSQVTKTTVDPKTSQITKDMKLLRQRLDIQAKDIENMQQTIKRLQNELRTAVALFNTRKNG